MSAYDASSEESLRARSLLHEWAGDGLITGEQHQHLEEETVSDLRTTNIFLRLVLFLFTLIAVAAAIGLFFFLFLSRPSQPTVGIALLFFSTIAYAAAEWAVREGRFYRHGIEEALAVSSVGLLCLGTQAAFFSYPYAAKPTPATSLVPVLGALLSVWIWRRFGLWYFFLAAMGFVALLPGHWTSSLAAQHLAIALLYAVGLLLLSATRPREDFLAPREAHSLAEALLWLGIYLALNLRLSALVMPGLFWLAHARPGPEIAGSFYWFTFAIIWCLPPLILTRAVRRKDRFVLWAGATAAVLTLASNKPYLGWQRHTWDPMLLGILLAGVAIYLRRWLAAGTNGVRHGFTAERLSRRDQRWLDAGASVLGLVSPQAVTPPAQTASPDVPFGGGASGGAGVSGDF
jgi:hypothetical protein